MRTRTAIRRDHRGSHLADTLYVRTPTGVVLLAGVHTTQRVQREREISDALALDAQRVREIQEAREIHVGMRDAGPYTRKAHVLIRMAEREVERLEALPPVHVPEPLPAVTIFAPPLVRDKRTTHSAQQPAGPAGTRAARHRPLLPGWSDARAAHEERGMQAARRHALQWLRAGSCRVVEV